jgi:hypothetical protein
VTVPAGKFHCIKLFYDQYRDDEHVQETAWYAEGVGQVKYDGGEYVKELKTYKNNCRGRLLAPLHEIPFIVFQV